MNQRPFTILGEIIHGQETEAKNELEFCLATFNHASWA